MNRNACLLTTAFAAIIAGIMLLGFCLVARAEDPPMKTQESIRAEQVRKLMKCGFPTILKMTVDDFAKLVPLPESTDYPVLVVSASLVPIATQCQLLGVTNLVDVEIRDIEKVPEGSVYWRYGTDDGAASRGMGESVVWCRPWLAHDGCVLANAAEILAIHREYPDTVQQGFGIDAPGSTCKPALCPYLWYNEAKKRVELATRPSDEEKFDWGSASFAK